MMKIKKGRLNKCRMDYVNGKKMNNKKAG